MLLEAILPKEARLPEANKAILGSNNTSPIQVPEVPQ
jgi:hypothetical protein